MATPQAEAARYFTEDILRCIKCLTYEKGYAYIVDVARRLGVNPNTMYSAIRKLVNRGFIFPLGPKGGRNERHSLRLTAEGDALAQQVLDRQQLLETWLIRLGLSADEAVGEANQMVHGLSERSFTLLQEHVKMATRYMGQTVSAKDLFNALPMPDSLDTAKDERMTRKIRRTVEQLGGVEGAERKRRLVYRAGGEENLDCLLEKIEAAGGVDAIMKLLAVLESWSAPETTLLPEVLVALKPLLHQGYSNAEYAALADILESEGLLQTLIANREVLSDLQLMTDRFGPSDKWEKLLIEAKALGGIRTLTALRKLSAYFTSPQVMVNTLNRSLKLIVEGLQRE